MARIRYNIIVMTSSKGVRKADFIATKDALRPGSIDDVLTSVVQSQYEHTGYGKRLYPGGTTKYVVRGLRFIGKGIDKTDLIFMWCPQTHVAVVVKVVRA